VGGCEAWSGQDKGNAGRREGPRVQGDVLGLSAKAAPIGAT
jgi:hypothetical protein